MRIAELGRLVSQSIRRNRRDFLLSSIGIVVGISTLLFFTALGSGIKQVVLEEIFVVRQLEVVKKSVDIAGIRTGELFGGKKLDENTVDRLAEIDDVAEVYPKMKLTFPASVRGGKSILGREMVGELIADGVPPRLVEDDELPGSLEFRDWQAEISCSSNDDCPDSHACEEGICEAASCGSPRRPDCSGKSYCHEDTGQCTMPIPVIASPKMLEIYNGSFQTAMGGARGMLSKLPKLSEDALVGVRFDGVFGQSFVGRSARGEQITYRMEFVGFSDKAIDLGATIPIGYVERLNKRFGDDDSGEFHSIVVQTDSNEAVARVAQRIKDMGFALSDRYEDAQRAGLLIMLLTLVFNFISLIILAISAVNIMHTFLMVILERRRELGLMRALGATRSDIRWLVIVESTVLGIFGGLAGLVVGWGAIALADYLFATQVGNFPFKPDSLFIIEPWMLAGGIVVGVFFCWLGSLWPAFQASHVDPARTLSGH
ncbi:MAG: ABC transporter permease [Persicimonas sp.]